jgi:hypothetical protein
VQRKKCEIIGIKLKTIQKNKANLYIHNLFIKTLNNYEGNKFYYIFFWYLKSIEYNDFIVIHRVQKITIELDVKDLSTALFKAALVSFSCVELEYPSDLLIFKDSKNI